MIPVSTSITPRPIYQRLQMRLAGLLPGPPDEDAKRDAIRVLGDPVLLPIDGLMRLEAERLFLEWGEKCCPPEPDGMRYMGEGRWGPTSR